jgi:hypothetical protein
LNDTPPTRLEALCRIMVGSSDKYSKRKHRGRERRARRNPKNH